MRCPDILDVAAEYAAREVDHALAAHASRARGPAPVYIGGVPCCADCWEPIPAARMAALPGVGLCVNCQREREGE